MYLYVHMHCTILMQTKQMKQSGYSAPLLTDTVASVWSQGEAGFTDALEAAVLVNAHAIQTHVGGCTFIMICKIIIANTNNAVANNTNILNYL